MPIAQKINYKEVVNPRYSEAVHIRVGRLSGMALARSYSAVILCVYINASLLNSTAANYSGASLLLTAYFARKRAERSGLKVLSNDLRQNWLKLSRWLL